ncbi:MAG TPA: hypothetical protein VM938_11765 [Acidimicrobiales bacterium]|nr:hypothetical protein [Acidimicrobiales bacterium]
MASRLYRETVFDRRQIVVLAVAIAVILLGDIALVAGNRTEETASSAPDTSLDGGSGKDNVPISSPARATGGTSTPAAAAPTTTMFVDVPPPPPMPTEHWTYRVTITPACVRPGEEVSLTFYLEPWVGAIVMAMYADGYNHDTRHAGVAREDGMVTYRWKAPPAPGTATVHTQAGDQRRKGATDLTLRVLGAGESC